MLANTRPLEGFILCAAVLLALRVVSGRSASENVGLFLSHALPLPAILGTSAHRNIFSSKPVTNPDEAFPSRTPNVITLRSREHAESAKSTKPVNSF